MKVGIYDRYLDTFGGGEKDFCVLAETLSARHQVELVTNRDVRKEDLEKRLNVDLSRVKLRIVFRIKNPFKWRLVEDLNNWLVSRRYELFFCLVNELWDVANIRNKKGVLRVQFPFDVLEDENYRKLLGRYKTVLSNSLYTRDWLQRRWGVKSEVLYPPVQLFTPGVKENVIISVGRFFLGFHNKKHIVGITAFKKLCDAGVPRSAGWEYHLFGSLAARQEDQDYIDTLKASSKGYPVFFHENAPFSVLSEYYGKARFFLHCAGYGEDPTSHPERFEHFGLSTVEAMSAGCVPLVFNGGGQPESVRDGVNGFLWETETELLEKLKGLMSDPSLAASVSEEAIKSSRDFGREAFRERVDELCKSFTLGCEGR